MVLLAAAPLDQVGIRHARRAACDVADGSHRASKPRTFWPEHGWYFRSLGDMTKWSPFQAARTSPLTWSMMVGLIPQLLAVTIVALISLVTKVSTIEAARQVSGDLDREFRSHGIGEPDGRAFWRPHLQSADRHQPPVGACWWRNTDERGHVCAGSGCRRRRECRSAGTDPDRHRRRPRLLPRLHLHYRRPAATVLSARLARSAARRRHHDRVHRVRLPRRRARRPRVRLRAVCHQLRALRYRAPARRRGRSSQAMSTARRRHPRICARPATPSNSTGSPATSSLAPPRACSSASAMTSRRCPRARSPT